MWRPLHSNQSKKYNKTLLIEKIKDEIEEYELLCTIDINPNQLWRELQDQSIDKDFFNFIGKSVVLNKKYCVDFDDVVKYLDYSRKYNAKRLLLEKFKHDIDYIMINEEKIKRSDDIFCYSIKSTKTGI